MIFKVPLIVKELLALITSFKVIPSIELTFVDAANTFEVHSNLQWHDCADTVEIDKYWYDPSSSSFKKLPQIVEQSTAGELAVDEEGNPTEAYDWDWDNEVWTKVQVL